MRSRALSVGLLCLVAAAFAFGTGALSKGICEGVAGFAGGVPGTARDCGHGHTLVILGAVLALAGSGTIAGAVLHDPHAVERPREWTFAEEFGRDRVVASVASGHAQERAYALPTSHAVVPRPRDEPAREVEPPASTGPQRGAERMAGTERAPRESFK